MYQTDSVLGKDPEELIDTAPESLIVDCAPDNGRAPDYCINYTSWEETPFKKYKL